MSRQAALYLRISSDPTGQRLGVTRQRRDCERKAAERGWHVAHVFEDNDVSASTSKRRPAYEAMLAAIRAGTITAVVVWDLDRLTRRPIEIEQFIELADTHGVDLASVGGDVDLGTDNGRMFARIKGAVARAEVERKTHRQKAANLQRREQGRPPGGGRRQFGYSADGLAVVEAEADAIRAAVGELLGGASMYGIAAMLNERGLPTTAGNPWQPTATRRLLSSPRIAGLVSHRGEVVGVGTWPPIIDEDTHHAIKGVLADPERHKAGPPRRYLLSGIALCGVCDQPVFGGYEKRKGYSVYRCQSRGHISRRTDLVDDHIENVIVARLERPDAIDLFAPPERVDRGRALRVEEKSLRSRLDGLAEAFAANDIDRAQLAAGTKRLRAKLTAATDELAVIARRPDVAELLTADDVTAHWLGLSVDRRRAIIRSAMTIRLLSPGRGARVFRPTTEVKIRWKGSK